ncbi:MAG: hypothetical protein AAGG51_18920 [Cyanobacteria bacterium P01_G01_bin.54]
MHRWIIFRAEPRQPGWQQRRLQHTQSLTKILAEHFDASDAPLPEVGYRPLEFIRVEQLADPAFPGEKTHYRPGDWRVNRVETYSPDIPLGDFDLVVVCHCEYSPINAPLKPLPEREVSQDSFGEDQQAHARWVDSQEKQMVTN